MHSFTKALIQFFGVAIRPQTYLNALYLLLSFPLGVLYFIFLITGIALGVPLSFLLIGLVILLCVFLAWYGLILFERQMAVWLLHENIPPVAQPLPEETSLGQRLTTMIQNPVTWKGLVYLGVKFPLGIFSFVMLVTLGSLSIALLAAPVYYSWWSPNMNITLNGIPWDNAWIIDTLPEALIACLVGVFVTLVSMHILNGLAWISGKFARVMLGNFRLSA